MLGGYANSRSFDGRGFGVVCVIVLFIVHSVRVCLSVCLSLRVVTDLTLFCVGFGEESVTVSIAQRK